MAKGTVIQTVGARLSIGGFLSLNELQGTDGIDSYLHYRVGSGKRGIDFHDYRPGTSDEVMEILDDHNWECWHPAVKAEILTALNKEEAFVVIYERDDRSHYICLFDNKSNYPVKALLSVRKIDLDILSEMDMGGVGWNNSLWSEVVALTIKGNNRLGMFVGLTNEHSPVTRLPVVIQNEPRLSTLAF